MIEKAKIFEYLTGGGDDGKKKEAIEEVFRQLDASPHDYYDISGEGTLYLRPGTFNGIGFALVKVQVTEKGMVEVSIGMGAEVPPKLHSCIRKLFRKYTSTFRLKGLVLEDGKPLFKTEPFDPLSSRIAVDEAVCLGLSTVHAYHGSCSITTRTTMTMTSYRPAAMAVVAEEEALPWNGLLKPCIFPARTDAPKARLLNRARTSDCLARKESRRYRQTNRQQPSEQRRRHHDHHFIQLYRP